MSLTKPVIIANHCFFLGRMNDAGTFNRIFVLEGRTSLSQTLAQICYFPLIFFLFGLVVGRYALPLSRIMFDHTCFRVR